MNRPAMRPRGVPGRARCTRDENVSIADRALGGGRTRDRRRRRVTQYAQLLAPFLADRPVTDSRHDRPTRRSRPTTLDADAARRSDAQRAAGTLAVDVVRSIGERLLSAAVAVAVDGEIQDLMTPLRTGGAFRVLTERDPEALGVLRHSAAHILATAVRGCVPTRRSASVRRSTTASTTTSRSPSRSRPRTSRQFEEEMREGRRGEVPVRARGGRSRARRSKRFADDPLKLERLDELGADEVISTYTDGPFIDLCRGPHVPDTSYAQALQAAAHRRRVLARRREAPDAAAHLRHRVLQEGRARRAPAPPRGGEEARPPRARASELDLFMFHPFAPGAAFWTERGTTLYNALERLHARAAARRLPRDQDAAAVQQGAVGDRRPLGQVPREHVPRARQRDRASTTSRSSR